MKEKKKGKSNGWRWKRWRPVVNCSPLFTCRTMVENAEDEGEGERERGRGKVVDSGENDGGRW